MVNECATAEKAPSLQPQNWLSTTTQTTTLYFTKENSLYLQSQTKLKEGHQFQNGVLPKQQTLPV